MKRVFALIGFSALLLLALLFVKHQRQQSPIYVLVQYPRDRASDAVVDSYAKKAPAGLFRSTWFNQERMDETNDCIIKTTKSFTITFKSFAGK